ncbi:hypothetical protein ACG04Q_20030 [Roseateles sp. DXS20W]|uniref:DUF3558 domain-containing protein n=1 Tax=Pelomonas lactea TaxID=3299030 RepID=A0ABW7GQ41_9BURK
MKTSHPLRTALAALTLAGALPAAIAAPAACPFSPDQLAQALGGRFAAGQEEPGIGGSSCKYASAGGGGSSVWVIVLKPGADQDMMRTMTAGGPRVKFEPIPGDPDGAARVRGGADENLVDVSYKRAGHVVFLRSLPAGHEPDARKREARAAELAGRLLKLPRLP